MSLKVCLLGATGWVGRELAPAIHKEADLSLVSAYSRSHGGENLGELLGIADMATPVLGTVEETLQLAADVVVEYTAPSIAKANVLAAIAAGRHVVIGTSGLTGADFAEIAAAAEKQAVGVLAAGNFAITAVLLQRFAEIAAKYVPQWEVIDYAGAGKKDAPSGTARELAYRLSQQGDSHKEVPINETVGPKESRGADINGTQVHSLRLPGFILSAEAIFGLPDERLTIRHDAGSSARPYVAGTLLAIRKVNTFTGLIRGLDQVMIF